MYAINYKWLRIDVWEHFLWHMVKLELYYISGACAHSGYCCQNMQLVVKGKSLDDLVAFEQYKLKYPAYSRFMPSLNSDQTIRQFSCKCLSSQNLCTDYQNRPSVCRQYPFSTFFQFDYIRSGCGYKVKRTHFIPSWIPLVIQRKMDQVKMLNSEC